MSYQFTPMNDEEIEKANEFPMLEDGIYNFEVIKSTKKTSRSGNPMAELQTRTWNKDGKEFLIYDFLVFSNVGLCIKKVKHFCDTTGLQEEYKAGNMREDLVGLSGKFEIGTQDAMPKPGGGSYARKNIVIDYVMTDKGAVKHESEPFIDDDTIPF